MFSHLNRMNKTIVHKKLLIRFKYWQNMRVEVFEVLLLDHLTNLCLFLSIFSLNFQFLLQSETIWTPDEIFWFTPQNFRKESLFHKGEPFQTCRTLFYETHREMKIEILKTNQEKHKTKSVFFFVLKITSNIK